MKIPREIKRSFEKSKTNEKTVIHSTLLTDGNVGNMKL
jgi:hypothetical protein